MRGDNEAGGKANRRIYGRGLFDGLRKAGIENPEDFMRNSRINETVSGLTGLPKRILDAVPIKEDWAASKIISELRRRGANPDHQFVMRYLGEFSRLGIIKETKPNVFTRLALPPVTDPARQPKAHQDVSVARKEESTDNPGSMEKLAEIALRARQLAEAIGTLANDIEECAIEVEERIESAQKDGAKLKQLHELIKSIS